MGQGRKRDIVMPTKFRFRWIPFVAALLAAAVGVSLGQWQSRRAAEKEAIEAKQSSRESAPPVAMGSKSVSVEEVEYRRVSLKGEFVPEWTVYLDNRPYKGIPGFVVLTPLKIAGSDTHVLVLRGWIKRDITDRTKIPPIATPPGIIEIQGVAKRSPGQILQLGEPVKLRSGAIVQNVTVAEFEEATNSNFQPVVVEQLTDTADGMIRDWPRPSSGVEKHRGYAFQWYALAATALIFFVVTGFRRGTN